MYIHFTSTHVHANSIPRVIVPAIRFNCWGGGGGGVVREEISFDPANIFNYIYKLIILLIIQIF